MPTLGFSLCPTGAAAVKEPSMPAALCFQSVANAW